LTAATLTRSAGYGPFALLAWAVRAVARLPQRNIVTVSTNVPGPRRPLTVLGRNIVELYPYVPIALRTRTGVAVLTYQDRLSFSITSDLRSVPETGFLAKADRTWPLRAPRHRTVRDTGDRRGPAQLSLGPAYRAARADNDRLSCSVKTLSASDVSTSTGCAPRSLNAVSGSHRRSRSKCARSAATRWS
jgi:hypothetical protein